MNEWNDAKLAEVEAYCEKATPGPWFERPLEFDDWGIVRGDDGRAVCNAAPPGRYVTGDCGKPEGPEPIPSNRHFISRSRTDLPSAVAEIRRLRKALEEISSGTALGLATVIIQRDIARAALGESDQ